VDHSEVTSEEFFVFAIGRSLHKWNKYLEWTDSENSIQGARVDRENSSWLTIQGTRVDRENRTEVG